MCASFCLFVFRDENPGKLQRLSSSLVNGGGLGSRLGGEGAENDGESE